MADNALKLPLGIDFSAFDRDLRKVADRIEAAGRVASAKVGAAAGDLAAGKLDPGQVNDAVASVGTRLAAGMADGLRASSSLMLGFAARTNSMLDRLVGSAVTIFRRIDSAMKFPAFDTFFKTAQLRLSNFSAIWRKPLSDLDIAVSGGFGGTIGRVAKVLKALFDGLAASIAGALKEAVGSLAAEVGKVANQFHRAEADASDLLGTVQKAAHVASANPFGLMPGRGAVPGVGRRLGFNTSFADQTVPSAAGAVGRRDLLGAGVRGAGAAFSAGVAGAQALLSATGKVGAALISVPLRAYIPFARLGNFLSTLGDVGKRSFHTIYEEHGLLVGSVLAGVKVISALGSALLRVGTLGVFGRSAREAQGFTRAVNASQAASASLAGAVRTVGREVLAAFGVVGVIYKAAQFLRDGVMAASDLNETVSRSKVVFGNSFGPVEAQANRMTKAFGLSRRAQLDVASGFGAMAQGAGLSEGASAKLANQLTKMAADLSSSVNIPFEEAGEKIRAALSGQAEPLRQFGADITATKVEAYALANGLATVTKSGKSVKVSVSDQNAVVARAGLIMRGLSYAQKDLERTSSSAANQFRKAGGGIQEFGVRLGAVLLPTVKSVAEGFNAAMAGILEWFDANAARLESWASAVRKVVGNVLSILRQLGGTVISEIAGAWNGVFGSAAGTVAEWGAAVTNWFGKVTRFLDSLAHNWGSYWQIVKSYGREALADLNAVLAVIPENTRRILGWLGRNWWNLLKDLANAILTAGKNIFTNAQILAAKVGDAIGSAWANLPDDFVKSWGLAFAAVLKKALEFAVAFGPAISGGEAGKRAVKQFNPAAPKVEKPPELPLAQRDFVPLLNGFKASTEKLPDLLAPKWADFGADRQKWWDAIAENDKKRAEAIAKPDIMPVAAPKPAAAVADAAKATEYRLAGAAEIDSKEAYSTIARSLSPRSNANDPGRQVARNTGHANGLLQLIANNTSAALARQSLVVK